MEVKLFVHPAFYRRVRHYRDRMTARDGRPQVSLRFVQAAQEVVKQLLKNPGSGHSARFDSSELAEIKRIAIPKFPVFAIFYRHVPGSLTIITLEHTAQDLPSRLANVVALPK